MKVVYFSSTKSDITWIRRYYRSVFPSGGKRAREQIVAIEKLLEQHPQIGRRLEPEDLREFAIPQTPFSFIYRIRGDMIEVVRLWDNRADRSAL